MTNHTPGPWFAREEWVHSELTPMTIFTGFTGDYDIAAVSNGENTVCGDPPNKECRANAALIAAAPEMLDALRLVVGCPMAAVALSRMPSDPSANVFTLAGGIENTGPTIYEVVTAAIAKATT